MNADARQNVGFVCVVDDFGYVENESIYVKHDYGFFSNCVIRLHLIVEYTQKYKKLPLHIDSSRSFNWYKPKEMSCYNEDVFFHYFEHDNNVHIVPVNTYFHHKLQFCVYKEIQNIDDIVLYVSKYFALNNDMIKLVENILTKYNVDLDNTCVLFYRGHDKTRETNTGSYHDFLMKAYAIMENNKGITFLIQSDESGFIQFMTRSLPNTIVFHDEIRHMHRNVITSMDGICGIDNYKYSKFFVAIVMIMARCKHIVCNTGNISLWIYFWCYIHNKNNIKNIHQFFLDRWY
jgi:hypothetical protein